MHWHILLQWQRSIMKQTVRSKQSHKLNQWQTCKKSDAWMPLQYFFFLPLTLSGPLSKQLIKNGFIICVLSLLQWPISYLWYLWFKHLAGLTLLVKAWWKGSGTSYYNVAHKMISNTATVVQKLTTRGTIELTQSWNSVFVCLLF